MGRGGSCVRFTMFEKSLLYRKGAVLLFERRLVSENDVERGCLFWTFLLFALVIAPGPGWAQDAVPVHRYDTHDGLPSRDVNVLAQSTDGLLWIGTDAGLSVYDGRTFRTVALPDSLQSSLVRGLQPMPDGSVWVLMSLGAVQVRPHGSIQSVRFDDAWGRAILRRGETVLFVTRRGVWTLAPGADQPTYQAFQHEIRAPSGAEGRPPAVGVGTWDAALDDEGRLWMLDGRRGPGRIQPDGSVSFVEVPIAPKGRQWYSLAFAGDGTALATQGPNLYRINPDGRSVELLTDTLSTPTRLQRHGNTMYLTREIGVERYDLATRRMREPLGQHHGLDGVVSTTTLRDRSGGLWVGTQNGLYHYMAPAARHVKRIGDAALQNVRQFMENEHGLWAATWGSGLVQLRPQRRQRVPSGRRQWVRVQALGTSLHALGAPEKEWRRWASPSNGWERQSIAAGAVRGSVDTSGIGYFWHDDGLYRHTPAADTTSATQLAAWPPDERDYHMVTLAPDGTLLLRDEGALLELRRSDGAVLDTLATFPDHRRAPGRQMVVDEAGRVWCAFWGRGLLRVDPDRDAHRLFLDDAYVIRASLLRERLVAAHTRSGLSLLDTETGTVRRRLTEADGLLSNNVRGSHLASDTLYVAHPRGLSLLPADSLRARPAPPTTVLTGLEVNLEQRPLTDSVQTAEERAVGFSYTAASLSYPDRVRYEVRLVPQDTTWRTSPRPFTRFTNLDPGTYQFEVRARLGDGSPGPPARYSFAIPPLFYETGWFRLLVGLALVGLGAAAYRWRVRRLERRRAELQFLVEERTRDLAEEKRKTEAQAERLAELDEAKNQFFAHISHEFRTPLSLILSPLRDVRRNETVLGRTHIRRMTNNAERLQRLIDQLLDLATLEAGQMELNRRPVDLSRFIQRTTEAFASRADRDGIALTVDCPDEALPTRVDPDKVEKIASNLLSNALKFTPEGGAVAVRLDRRDGEAGEEAAPTARLAVTDTGPGVDPEAHERIFDRFAQADPSATREQEGTGLGLALTKQLVELHGGTIDLESTPGEGSTFIVSLPIVPVAEGEVGERVHGRERESERGSVGDGEHGGLGEERSTDVEEEAATILVVEDNDEMRAYLREVLAEAWSVRTAADGAEGWQAVQDDAPDLVLSDVMMPAVDGFELCRRIKADERLRVTPVLLLTARAGEEAAVEGLECGADDYVAKPFDVAELTQRIENHLAARRHLQARYREELDLGTMVADEAHRPFVERLLDVVEQHLSNPDLTTSLIADEMALSRRQLTRRVKKATGHPPGTFLRKHRLERAKAMLERKPETVAEVAYAVGFTSPSAFSNSFREEVGVTPTTYVDQQA